MLVGFLRTPSSIATFVSSALVLPALRSLVSYYTPEKMLYFSRAAAPGWSGGCRTSIRGKSLTRIDTGGWSYIGSGDSAVPRQSGEGAARLLTK
jgi:hypothetical protein